MSVDNTFSTSRRQFLATTGVTAGALMAASNLSASVYAGEDNTIQVALVGCGGRGTGAALNSLSVKNGNLKLVAMGDVFPNNIDSAHNALKGKKEVAEMIDVPDERRFVGFDAYKSCMDCLKPGDIVILATPPGFRWVHYTYAIEKGLNVFMEKPVTIDAPTSVRFLEINKKAVEKNLKVAVGLMCRHCDARKELLKRINDGEIGEITMLRAYRMAGLTASAHTRPQRGNKYTELEYQIKNFHSFLWLSGGAVSDFLIHNIDEACWMKGKWPVSATALGGRHYRGDYIDQNFDTYSMEYTFDDGAKLFVDGRTIPGCQNEFASFAHGTKGVGVISTAGHWPAHCAIHKGQSITDATKTWAFPQPEPNPYQLEWDHFITAIRDNAAYNEVERGVMASAVTSMGRMAAHTGQEITLEKFMKHDHEFAPNIANLTADGPAPLQMNENGKYPVPSPGIVIDREYA
ncbi:Gfo/Idh/MocA family protein [Lacunimicrobium album]